MKYPRVWALHNDLRGEWEECYHAMHRVAIAIETEFSCQAEEVQRLRLQVEQQQKIIDMLLTSNLKSATSVNINELTPSKL